MATTIEQADREEILHALSVGRKVAPEVARRVHERAQRVRDDIRRQHGVQNIGVEIIRELRDSR